MELIISLLFAAAVGYLAGMFMGMKNPWYVNIILGLLGGIVGSAVFRLVGLRSSAPLGEIIIDIVGACIVILIYKQIKK